MSDISLYKRSVKCHMSVCHHTIGAVVQYRGKPVRIDKVYLNLDENENEILIRYFGYLVDWPNESLNPGLMFRKEDVEKDLTHLYDSVRITES